MSVICLVFSIALLSGCPEGNDGSSGTQIKSEVEVSSFVYTEKRFDDGNDGQIETVT